MKDWRKVFNSKNGYKAELLKNDLLAHDIHAVVMSNQETILHIFGEYEVYVPENEETIAKEIVDLFNQNETETE